MGAAQADHGRALALRHGRSRGQCHAPLSGKHHGLSRNLTASIRARLKRYADTAGQDFNLTLTHCGLERLRYRLSVSPHAGNYLLKGALLFSLWYDQPHRPTRDADLLGFGPDDIDATVSAFHEICQIVVEDDIVFDPASVKGSVIHQETGYGGVRVDLPATLDGARIALQVDIGFGDAVTPAPESVIYPVLLSDLPAPQLRAYARRWPGRQLREAGGTTSEGQARIVELAIETLLNPVCVAEVPKYAAAGGRIFKPLEQICGSLRSGRV